MVKPDFEHILFFGWTLASIFLKIDPRVNFVSGLVALSFSPLFLIFRNETWADRAAVFAFLFLLIGSLQQVWSQFSRNRSSR
jgi:hypothetical protein